MEPRDLPIYELESALVASLRAAGRVIVQAPTGSGKSTQIPQILLRHRFLERGPVYEPIGVPFALTGTWFRPIVSGMVSIRRATKRKKTPCFAVRSAPSGLNLTLGAHGGQRR